MRKSRNDTVDSRLIGSPRPYTWLHNSFETGLFIKGFDGILEMLGGLVLMFANPERLNRMVIFLTQHELSEDPHDMLANYLLKISRQFSVNSQHFGVFYLLSHGVVKLFLVIMLYRRKLWAYPLSIVFLLVFISYQIYRYTYRHSLWLVILTVFDAVMIGLTWLEYQRVKQNIVD